MLELPVYGKAMLAEKMLVERADKILVKHLAEVTPTQISAVGLTDAGRICAKDGVLFGCYLKDAVLLHLCCRRREQQALALEPVGRQRVRNGADGAALEVGTRILEEEIVLAKAWLLLVVFIAFPDKKFQLLSYPRGLFGLNQHLLQRAYACYLKGSIILVRKSPEWPQKQDERGELFHFVYVRFINSAAKVGIFLHPSVTASLNNHNGLLRVNKKFLWELKLTIFV